MKKEVIIVVLILALLLWLWSSKVNAQAPVVTTPVDETEPITESYTVKSGDSIWKIAKKRLPVGTSNEIIYDYVVQISEENGKNPALIDGVLQKNVNDPDLIYPGEILVINQYTPN